MGQKTHPTGFRTGINKKHSATWFANYGAYSEVLKEDYKIRKFFEKEFESVYSKAGIAKLEIQRKVNQLELVIHAARPKAITADTENSSLITNLKDNLTSLVEKDKFLVGNELSIADISVASQLSLLSFPNSSGDTLKGKGCSIYINDPSLKDLFKWRDSIEDKLFTTCHD